MGKGSGGGNQTVTQVNIPSYAKPYYQVLMREAVRYVQRKANGKPKYDEAKYAEYTAKRVADLQSQTTDALNDIKHIDPFNTQMDYGVDTQKTSVTSLGTLISYTPAEIEDDRNFTQAKAQPYMTGYEIEVADKAVARINREFDRQAAERAAEAVAAGALGGTRFAVATQMANEERNIRIGELYANATKEGYVFAAEMYARDTDRDVGIDEANLQAKISAKQLNLSAIQTKAQIAGVVFDEGVTITEAKLKVADANVKAGDIKRQYNQQKLDQYYKDFVNQRDWHKQNLGFLAATMKSVPQGVNSDVVTTEGGNNFGTAIAGLATLMGGK
jgi:hypothetical protein